MSNAMKIVNELCETIPPEVCLKILLYLKTKDILSFSLTCKRYNEICKDDFLWRKLFYRDFTIYKQIELKPGADSWNSEYKRLSINVPIILTEVLEQHSHQVLHVSFSNNGEMFATCSKDANVIIWNSSYPCSVRNAHNMKKYTWRVTQYSQFNRTDTLLLVSGILFSSSDMGEIAVFTINKNWSSLHCRVYNRPYDIFGTWFSDQYLISGDLNYLAHMVNSSIIWLNKANQDVSSDNKIITKQMYKFYNRSASTIRAICVAHCPWLNDLNDPLKINDGSSIRKRDIENNFDSFPTSDYRDGSSSKNLTSREKHLKKEFYKIIQKLQKNEKNDDDFENFVPKYLIFSTGSKTYLPHEIGIKRVKNISFSNHLNPGPSFTEGYELQQEEKKKKHVESKEEPNWNDYNSVADRFDKIDKIIDLHGHIIGMALSPDHRYLYVNTRPWPKNYIITNPLEPPPIAQEIDIHVIDLTTLKPLECILRAHKAYTPNTECFFIFLNVCDDYVASGAEDKHAYIWDRFYGHCLAKYKHQDVVNSVAFNPKDSEMLVTTSDDHSIKIWRSKDKVKKLNIPFNEQATEFRKKNS